MTFLNPFILLALPVAAIPFFLHLMRRRRAPKQEFTYLRFLREAHRQRFLSFRLQEMLLLVLRTALIIGLVLALAGPTLPTGQSGLFRNLLALGTPGREILVVVDNSLSMSATENGSRRLDTAIALAEDLYREARGTDRVRIISSQELLQETGAFPSAGESIGTAMAAIQPTTGTWEAVALVERAIGALESPDMGLAVIVSDWQASAWRDFNASSIPRSSRATRSNAIFVDVSTGTEKNVWFDEVKFPHVAALAGEPLGIQLRISGTGLSESGKIIISSRDGAGEILDSRSIALNAPLDATGVGVIDTAMTILPQPAGTGTEGAESGARFSFGGEITLSHETGFSDALEEDNQIRFVAPVIRDMNVLIAAHEKDAWTPFVVQLALETPPAEGAASPVRCAVLATPQIDASNLDQYDAVVLAGPAPAGSAAAAALNDYVREGGGLLWIVDQAGPGEGGAPVVPGTRAGIGEAAKPRLFGSLFRLQWLLGTEAQAQGVGSSLEELLGVLFELEWSSAEGRRVTEVAWEHPVLADLADFGKGAFQSARFWKGMEITDIDRPLLSADHIRLLSEKDYGQGRVLLLASGLGKTSSDLAVNPIFLPLLQQCVKYAAFGDVAGESAARVSHLPAAESDLRPLTGSQRRWIEEIAPIQFVKPDAAQRIATQGTAGRSLTSPLIALCILLSLMELAAANLRK